MDGPTRRGWLGMEGCGLFARVDRVTRGWRVFYLVQGDARRNQAAANSCKEFGATGPGFLVPSSSCYLPRAEAPLTTIYRVERRSLRNQFLLAAGISKTFQSSLFFHSTSPFTPLPRRPLSSLEGRSPETKRKRGRERERRPVARFRRVAYISD